MPPLDYEICPSCGTEFEYHDAQTSHAELRQVWISNDAPWHSRVVAPPVGWNPYVQMTSAGLYWTFAGVRINIHLQANATVERDGRMNLGDRNISPLACVA